MDGYKERRHSGTRGNLSVSRGCPVEPWHSTPVKKNLFATEETPDASPTKLRGENRTVITPQNPSKPTSSFSLPLSFQMPADGLEISTIQRQRLELQLLIAELKDRDQELNAMAAAHQRQLQSWELDRQRVLILEQRGARLEDELQKRKEVIKVLSRRTKVVEEREKDAYKELNSSQQQLQELSQKQLNTTRHQQDLVEKNQSLNSTVMMLSSQVGQLQVREEELSSMLKLKDKDLLEATNHILELSGRLCDLEKSLKELRTRESKTLRETEEHKHGFRESRHENTQLKAELREKTIENNRQREELIRLKQENQLLKKELAGVQVQLLSEERSWKDDLLELSRSKQARAESELLCLRQVCENQQNDLQLLKLNLESAREQLRHLEGQRSRHHEGRRSLGRPDSGLGCSRVVENSEQQDTELETGLISSQSHSTVQNLPSVLTQRPRVEAETQTDFERNLDGMTFSVKTLEVTEQSAVGEDDSALNSVHTTDTRTASQCTINEQESHDCQNEMREKETPSKENSCLECSPRSASAEQLRHLEGQRSPRSAEAAVCRDNSSNSTDSQTHQTVCRDAGTGVDVLAVIDYDPDTGTPVCVIDVDVSPRYPCAADLSCLQMDSPSLSPGNGRGPGRLRDSALSIELNANEEGFSSSTSRLQRLIAESREMVASLECSTGKPVSPAQSLTNGDAVRQPRSSHGNSSHHNHSQASTHSQEGSKTRRESDSQIKSSPQLQQGNQEF